MPNREYVQLSEADFELHKTLITNLAENSDHYLDLRARDICDVVKALVLLKLQCQRYEQGQKFCDKQLRVLAKRSALMMGNMNQKSRESIVDSFSKIDFYDNDLVQALKKYKLVKGSDKR